VLPSPLIAYLIYQAEKFMNQIEDMVVLKEAIKIKNQNIQKK